MLYGGAKSRLRSLVQPFYGGTIYLYADEAKGSAKITDFDAQNCHPSFRKSLFKIWAANLACEIAVKTRAAGDAAGAYTLVGAFLDGLDLVSEEQGRAALLRFLERYLSLLGLAPDAKTCAKCGAPLLRDAGGARFVQSALSFECPSCYAAEGKKNPADFALDRDALTYLCAIDTLPPREVRAIALPPASAARLKAYLFSAIERACGAPLETLRSASGIL